MMTVCIPVYNNVIDLLIKHLCLEIQQLDKPVEIIVMDDASTNKTVIQANVALLKQYNLTYYQQTVNQGRSKIRKLLAEKAAFEHLLFLDNDVMPATGQFLSHYLNVINIDGVFCGGCIYQKMPPPQPYLLHWKYGRLRETKHIEKDKHHPTVLSDGHQMVRSRILRKDEALVTANLFITKTLLSGLPETKFPFGYGHEDTWLTVWLQARKIPLHLLDNPVFHLGLKTGAPFLLDQKRAVMNILHLYHTTPYRHELLQISGLLRSVDFVKRLKLGFLFKLLYKPSMYLLKKALLERDVSLRYMDMYKLLIGVVAERSAISSQTPNKGL